MSERNLCASCTNHCYIVRTDKAGVSTIFPYCHLKRLNIQTKANCEQFDYGSPRSVDVQERAGQTVWDLIRIAERKIEEESI